MKRKQGLANAIGIVLIVLSVAALAYSVLNPPTNPSSSPPQPQPSVTLTDERWWCKYNDFGSGTYSMSVDFNLTETTGVDAAVVVQLEDIGPGFGRTARTYYVTGHSKESGSFIVTNMSECSSNPFLRIVSVERF